MNLYEEHLYELYEQCFNLKFYEWMKETDRREKNCFLVMIVSLVILTVSYLGLLLKQQIFVWIGLLAFFVFIASFFVWLLYKKICRKALMKRARERNVIRLRTFNILLIKHGLGEDQQVSIILEALKSNYLDRCKVKERRHDVFFKYFVTFIVSVLVFVSKEKWERIKPNISESDFNALFEVSVKVLIFLFIVSMYIFIINYNTFGSTKEEKLIKALEEVLLYRKGVKVLPES